MDDNEKKVIVEADKPQDGAAATTAETVATPSEGAAAGEPAVINLSGEDDIAPEKAGWLKRMRKEDMYKSDAERTEKDILDLNDRLGLQQVVGKFAIIIGLVIILTGIAMHDFVGILISFEIIGGLTVAAAVYFNQFNFRIVVRALEQEIIKDGAKAEAEVADAVVLKAGKTYRECKILYRIKGTKKMVFRVETYDNIEAIPIGKKYEIAYERTSGYAVKIAEIEEFSGEEAAKDAVLEKIAAAENELK